jgi:ribose transport system ATP-binding protein
MGATLERTDRTEGDAQRVALSVAGVSKTFPGTQALLDVSFSISKGEIHALLGGNGSGKSTLVKILAGVYRADPGGTLRIEDTEIPADNMTPALSRSLGLRFVHQNPAVFLPLTIAENLVIGQGFPTSLGKIRWRDLKRRSRSMLDRVGIDADPGMPLEKLRPADRTMVAVARALQDQDEDGATTVLVLDEATASLPEHEVEILFQNLRRCVDAGETIIYVTHIIDEVRRLADSFTVLRDGRLVTTRPTAGVSEAEIIGLIVGRPLDHVFPPVPEHATRHKVLELKGVAGGPLRGVDLTVHGGEIVGIGGLLGCGRSELLRMLLGAEPMEAGEVLLDGKPFRPRSPVEAVRQGVVYVPEDRDEDGAYPNLSLRSNLSIGNLAHYWRRWHVDGRLERRDAREAIGAYNIRTRNDQTPFGWLSGGNQQKAIFARVMSANPRVLLLDEPTQGVDVGARADVHAAIRTAVERGIGAILISSDFEELAQASDRVLVLRDGRIAGELAPPHLDRHRLTEMVYARNSQ